MNRAVRAASIGVLLCVPVALAGCSAGQINQTSTQNRDKYGAGALIGDLTIRNAALAYPSGGMYQAGQDAELQMVVANPATTSDVLVSMSGPGFTGVQVSGTGTAAGAGQTCAGGGSGGAAASTTTSAATSSAATTSSSSGGAAAGGTASTSATGGRAGATTPSTGTASTTASTGTAAATGALPTGVLSSTSPLPTPAGGGDQVGIAIPADCAVTLGENVPHVFLTGLTQPLTAAAIVPVTMTFQRAGTLTVPCIVSPPSQVIPKTSTYDFTQQPGKPVQGAAHGG